MALHLLLMLFVLAATLLTDQAQGISSSASDCCLNYSRRAIPSRLVKSYNIQETALGCAISAVVFITKKDKKICASPDNPTVQRLMKNLDKKVKSDNKNKKQEQPSHSRARSKRQKQ
ncbi:C-C motif chemokine 21 [Indicator indicator]|uniref:C-C motif chemokine 21 n=1 Tax=Indicator indicator TaxID=1002788 RepID=UPI0023DECDFC|nr:C-C motif chemokine 21 [Indicator indicator]